MDKILYFIAFGNSYVKYISHFWWLTFKVSWLFSDNKRRVYSTREEARGVNFDYIEVFYNRRRRHSHLCQLSPADYAERECLNEAIERQLCCCRLIW